MKLKPIAVFLILSALSFFLSCHTGQQPGSNIAPDTETFLKTREDTLENDRQLDSLFTDVDSSDVNAFAGSKKDTAVGRMVGIDTIQSCLDEFKKVMPKHGFDYPASATSVTVNETSLITYYERFRGTEMMRFLRKAAHLRHHLLNIGAKKHVSIRVEFGIYTMDYLKKIGADTAKAGRLAIFLVTREINTETTNNSFAPVTVTDPGDDPQALDFGGLKP